MCLIYLDVKQSSSFDLACYPDSMCQILVNNQRGQRQKRCYNATRVAWHNCCDTTRATRKVSYSHVYKRIHIFTLLRRENIADKAVFIRATIIIIIRQYKVLSILKETSPCKLLSPKSKPCPHTC